MPRHTGAPWGKWARSGLERGAVSSLTFTEVNAIKQAHATGRFSKASLARIYDTQWYVINLVVKGTYRYHREE